MRAHGFDNRQELYQTMVLYLADAPADEVGRVLTPAASGFVMTKEQARQLKHLGMAERDTNADWDSPINRPTHSTSHTPGSARLRRKMRFHKGQFSLSASKRSAA